MNILKTVVRTETLKYLHFLHVWTYDIRLRFEDWCFLLVSVPEPSEKFRFAILVSKVIVVIFVRVFMSLSYLIS